MGPLFAIILSILALFLVLLVLVQRGRGGGLAGALGGMGGSSAFGAKAGDIFTRITIVTASIWIAFCLIALFWSKHHGDAFTAAGTTSSSNTGGCTERS
jgi:preprotein translocase subunit SecG